MSLYGSFSNHKVKKQLLDKVRANYRKTYPAIKQAIKELVETELRKAFNKSDTVKALRNGKLVSELGLVDSIAKVAKIRDTLIKGMIINLSANKSDALIEIKLAIGEDDFSDILEIDAAFQEWTDAKGEEILGPPLPWLKWLLIQGDFNIVNYYFTKKSGVGRTGEKGIMVEKEGAHWRVPPEHAGTIDENFITKIFKEVGVGVQKKLWQIVRPVLTLDS